MTGVGYGRRLVVRWCSDVSVCKSWESASAKNSVFNDDRFHQCPEDNRGCIWRHLGQRGDPSLTIACDTSPQQGVGEPSPMTAGTLW
ncbi:hypothetical protein TNCV_2281991 [Trichonephila clavipes]|nr:hypothetical protein TNCV_2281991 [Trichonephila clavipes]